MPERLPWPPKREDLEKMYVTEKLSAAKIARAYGLEYASEKTAESTVLFHLKKNGIPRRDRSEHVRRVTPELLDEWVMRYRSGESLKQISAGAFSPATVFYHLKSRGVELRDKVDAQIMSVTKHQRRPFSGDPLERAYLVGMRIGDLDVVRHGRAVRVRVSTTHPAMIQLFTVLFSRYGHVQKYPKRSVLTEFEWTLECDLDSSFQFLLDKGLDWVELTRTGPLFLSFLAGFFDADGSVFYHKKGTSGGFEFALTNVDKLTLELIASELGARGFHPRILRARQRADRGVKNGSEVIWKLSLWRHGEVARILGAMPVKHQEKRDKRDTVLDLTSHESRDFRRSLLTRWDLLRASVKAERDTCVAEASRAYCERRPEC